MALEQEKPNTPETPQAPAVQHPAPSPAPTGAKPAKPEVPEPQNTPEAPSPDAGVSHETPPAPETPRLFGRPSEYGPEVVSKAAYYLDHFGDTGEEVFPSVAGLADYINVHRQTIYNWAADPAKSDFLDILEKVMHKQEKLLINKGAKGVFNSTITKLMLTKHNYSDKIETDITTGGEKLNELPEKDRAKLDKILHGTQPTTTEQSSVAGNDNNARSESS